MDRNNPTKLLNLVIELLPMLSFKRTNLTCDQFLISLKFRGRHFFETWLCQISIYYKRIFRISSAATCIVSIRGSWSTLGELLGFGDKGTSAGEATANLFVGLAMAHPLAIFAPAIFGAGLPSAYLVAAIFNATTPAKLFFRVPIGAIKPEEN